MHRSLIRLVIALLSVAASNVLAQDVQIYTDGLLNGFASFSYGGGSDFGNLTPFHNGAPSIAFTGNANLGGNTVSFAHPSATYASGSYFGLRFFVHGGGTGGQQISLMLQTNSAVNSTQVLAASVALDGYIAGGSIPANSWAQVDVPFNSLNFNNDGSFDRIDIISAAGVQPVLYIDDVSLVAAQNSIFTDSFEPEYMLVPQYSNFDGTKGAGNSIKVYQRTNGASDFAFLREVPLGTPSPAANPLRPNAVTFAPDGGLWVVDDGNSMLWRYTLQSILTGASPAPTAHAGPTGAGGLYDLAFFGAFAYVSSDSGILKYTIATISSTAPTVLSAPGATPVGLAFDTQGRLWICNYGVPGNLVRMSNLSTGAIDVTISGANINNAEGLAFDQYGSLWVGDNNEPTLYGYGSWQLSASGSPTPVGQIDVPTPAETPVGSHPSGFVGGIAFDRRGDVRASFEYNYTVQAYALNATPHSGGGYEGYTSSALTPLTGATSDPGRGGIAFWPVPNTLHTK